jgi:hypothetical protein
MSYILIRSCNFNNVSQWAFAKAQDYEVSIIHL